MQDKREEILPGPETGDSFFGRNRLEKIEALEKLGEPLILGPNRQTLVAVVFQPPSRVHRMRPSQESLKARASDFKGMFAVGRATENWIVYFTMTVT